ncbi:MAG: phospho-sugar mutase, partial [Clostridia bacterium]|nr:phospho-sugar mutase [Clostridia bacterium]
MENERILNTYRTWMDNVKEEELAKELRDMQGDEARIEDAFYRDLEFGTAGLRGVLGAGTNRMNIYTVGRAAQGVANYVLRHFEGKDRSIAISYDSRINSDLFARVSADIFAANGITAHIYPLLMPVPCLSYATRELHCAAGIMVTASHNPSKYNGYKVYGPDGCQITTEAADEILAEIEGLDAFRDIRRSDFDQGLKEGLIRYIGEDLYTAFIERVKQESMLTASDRVDKDVAIVYTPLNGAGLRPVTRILKECGFTNITVVKEQEQPDGHFPTCPYPNPEIFEAMKLGMEYARTNNADLLLATDPDADRCGIAVRDAMGEYQLLTGNETGMLLLDYICSRRAATGRMPAHPVMVK